MSKKLKNTLQNYSFLNNCANIVVLLWPKWNETLFLFNIYSAADGCWQSCCYV